MVIKTRGYLAKIYIIIYPIQLTLRLVLFSTHLLPNFDSVIMLHNGEVVASGSIPELLSNPGPVHDLWQGYSLRI